jgi:deoxycytidine triphosphate deaminase
MTQQLKGEGGTMLLVDKDINDIANKIVRGGLGPSHIRKDDQIQPSSIDLRVGKIFLPGDKEATGELKFKTSHSLAEGETAIIETREWLTFPNTIAAMGFPPAHVSAYGLLMTNPGHVDPGYEGHLRFTVINMGKEPFALREGMAIVTLLLFKLETAPVAPWSSRGNTAPPPDSTHDANLRRTLDGLSRDFLSVTARAKEESDRINRRNTFLVTAITAAGLVISAVIANFSTVKGSVEQLTNRVAKIEEKNIDQFKDRVTKLEEKIDYDKLKSRVQLLETASKIAPSQTQK